MAMFGSNAPTEVGLKFLLCPLNSNVLTRTACCSVGIVLPVYSTFKAIESKSQNDQQKWLLYWAAYGSFSIVEIFTDKFLYWFPLYYQVKFAFLVWLQLPSADAILLSIIRSDRVEMMLINAYYSINCKWGARQLYEHHLRPFLVKHQARFDQVVGLLYSEMANFVSTHQAEFQFAKMILTKTLLAVRDVINPGQQQVDGAVEGQATIEEASESEDDE